MSVYWPGKEYGAPEPRRPYDPERDMQPGEDIFAYMERMKQRQAAEDARPPMPVPSFEHRPGQSPIPIGDFNTGGIVSSRTLPGGPMVPPGPFKPFPFPGGNPPVMNLPKPTGSWGTPGSRVDKQPQPLVEALERLRGTRRQPRFDASDLIRRTLMSEY